MRTIRILLLTGLLLAAVAAAGPLAAQDEEDFLDFFNPYGSFRAHLAYYDSRVEVQNNGSRIGIMMASSEMSGWSLVARGEWGINLVKNDVRFNLETSDITGATLKEGDPEQALWTRLGYMGFQYGNAGEVTMGKRWSVYSDVASWTDMFDISGGWASGMYSGGTDGGYLGTGRAEKVVMYRNTVGRVFLGAQAQFRGEDERAVEAYGLACHAEAAPGLSVGVGWNDSHIWDVLRRSLTGAKNRARALVTGIKYENDRVYLAGIYTWQDGNEVARTDSIDIAYSCHGAELYLQTFITKNLRLNGGFNLRMPIDPLPALPADFGLRHYILGAALYLHRTAYVYAEYRYDDSVYGDGSEGWNVFSMGVWMNFASPRRKH